MDQCSGVNLAGKSTVFLDFVSSTSSNQLLFIFSKTCWVRFISSFTILNKYRSFEPVSAISFVINIFQGTGLPTNNFLFQSQLGSVLIW